MKRFVYGVFAAVLALGFSAYTNAQQEYQFYNVSSNPTSVNPTDYEYQPSAVCDPSPDNCRVTEVRSQEPAIGENPSPSAMNDIEEGTAVLP